MLGWLCVMEKGKRAGKRECVLKGRDLIFNLPT